MKREEKIKLSEKLVEEFKKYSVIGIIDVNKLPSKILQIVKKEGRDNINIEVIKKSVLLRVLQKIGRSELEKIVPNQPAVILSNEDPFKIFIKIDKLKTPVYAKDGDITENDVLVTAGRTDLMPGPVISELAKVKIPAGVEEGKIAIKKDVVVAKKGDKISKDLASVLRKLKIETVRIGVNIIGIYSNRQIYKRDVLNLVNEVPSLLIQARMEALNLSVGISYPTKDNISLLLSKAQNNAKALELKIGGAS